MREIRQKLWVKEDFERKETSLIEKDGERGLIGPGKHVDCLIPSSLD